MICCPKFFAWIFCAYFYKYHSHSVLIGNSEIQSFSALPRCGVCILTTTALRNCESCSNWIFILINFVCVSGEKAGSKSATSQSRETLLASAVAKMQRLYDAVGVAFSFFFFFYSRFLEFCANAIHKKRMEIDFAVFARDYVEKA